MKCKNCNCSVSSDFKYAFTTNCCPKCGQSIMTEDVMHLYIKMESVLEKNNNDIGDLAVWFVNEYFSLTTPTKQSVDKEESVDNEEQIENVQPIQVRKPLSIKRSIPPNEQAKSNIFAKRAGVEKLINAEKKINTDFDNILKDIQEPQDYHNDNSYEEQSLLDTGEKNYSPLSVREIDSVANLFSNEGNLTSDFNEIQKLQKLEQLSMTGSLGKIKRST